MNCKKKEVTTEERVLDFLRCYRECFEKEIITNPDFDNLLLKHLCCIDKKGEIEDGMSV